MQRIFVINPGATSTKTAVFEDEKCVWMSGGHHPTEEISRFRTIAEQYPYRLNFVLKSLSDAGLQLNFDAVIGRGGLTHPLQGGVYAVNEQMRYDLIHAEQEHACNFGALIAYDLAERCHCPAYIADPVVVDELMPEARLTGLPFIERKSIFHALNSKAVARRHARSVGRNYEDMNLIVAHLGGGISVGAHRKGKVVDVNNALNGEGPFSPERAGTLPAYALVDLCFEGKYDKRQIKKMLSGYGGLMAHLGTKDMITISAEAEQGHEPYCSVLSSMLYTVAKQIAAMTIALDGQVDAIILTGGIAHSRYCTDVVSQRVGFIAPVVVIPGEGEMESLAFNALGALRGELPLREY